MNRLIQRWWLFHEIYTFTGWDSERKGCPPIFITYNKITLAYYVHPYEHISITYIN